MRLTDHGGTAIWTPPERISPEQIARARNPPTGDPLILSVGIEGTPGHPADRFTPVIAGTVTTAYASEWHSEVLDPLNALGVDFVEMLATGGGDIDSSHPVGAAIARQNFRDSSDRSLMPGVNTFRRDFIYKAFNRDTGVAKDLDAVVQVSTLFTPMLERHGWNATGTAALELAVPNLAVLEWEQILEFRQHPGAQEAREMLREFEVAAVEEEPADAQQFLASVAQEITTGLFSALAERSLHLSRDATAEAAKAAISFIPVVGPFVSIGATAAELAATRRSQAHSGIAALMVLRERADI